MPHPSCNVFAVVLPFLAFVAPGTAQTTDYVQHLTMMVPVTQAQREVSVSLRDERLCGLLAVLVGDGNAVPGRRGRDGDAGADATRTTGDQQDG